MALITSQVLETAKMADDLSIKSNVQHGLKHKQILDTTWAKR